MAEPTEGGPTPTRKRGAATRDPIAAKILRVRTILLMRESQTLSNRDLAELVCVDEAMIRRWKDRLSIPQLPQHSGASGGAGGIDLPPETPTLAAPAKRKRGRKPKKKD
jgi:hypothetical protein